MKAIFTPTELNKTNHTPQATISTGHTHAKHPTRLRCALRRWTLLTLLALTSVSIKAAYYVFVYYNGYLPVDNNGAITYATTFNPQCIWTCVSNTRYQKTIHTAL